MRDSRDGNGTVGIVGDGGFYRDRYILDKCVLDCVPYLGSCSVTVGLECNGHNLAFVCLTTLGSHCLHCIRIVSIGSEACQCNRRSCGNLIVQIYLHIGAFQFLGQRDGVFYIGRSSGNLGSGGRQLRHDCIHRLLVGCTEQITPDFIIKQTASVSEPELNRSY